MTTFLGEIISTMTEASTVLGVSRTSVYRLRTSCYDFPSLPTFRVALVNWAAKRDVPRKRGRHPTTVGDAVAELREEGKTFTEIGKALCITKQAAWAAWKRMAKSEMRKQA